MFNATQRYPLVSHLSALGSLTNVERYDAVVEQMNVLLDKQELTPAEQELLPLLGTLGIATKDAHYPDANFVAQELFQLEGRESA